MIILKNYIHFFIASTRDSVSLKFKIAVLGHIWEENNYLRHHNIFAPLGGIYGSKAVEKTLLGVSSKIGEAKIKRELEFFQRNGF